MATGSDAGAVTTTTGGKAVEYCQENTVRSQTTWPCTERTPCQRRVKQNHREVEDFFNTMRLGTNLSDNNRPFSEEDGSGEGMEASRGMIDSVKKFFIRDNVEVVMSIDEARKRAFNDREEQVQAENKAESDRLKAVNDGALTLKSCDVGAVNTLVHIPAENQELQAAAIKEAEWTASMQIIKENLNETDCILIQQMVQARGEKESETVKICCRSGRRKEEE